MKFLAWDTSSKLGALVALEAPTGEDLSWGDVRLVKEMNLNVDASSHSEKLLWGIDQLLRDIQWKLEDVDVFGVGVGPGSFTGLRIGITTARTLAHTLSKPLVPLSSLASLIYPVAEQFKTASTPIWVIGATDACKGELFALAGLASGGMRIEEGVFEPETLMSKIEEALQSVEGSRWIAVGEGRHRYGDFWQKLPQDRRHDLSDLSDSISGTALGRIFWEAWKAGMAADPLTVMPRYLRASDAEIKLKRGLLPWQPDSQDL